MPRHGLGRADEGFPRPAREGARDGRGDEAVGRGDHGAQLARIQVAPHQRACRRADHGRNAAAHELGMPAFQLLGRVCGERPQREAEEFVDVERARLVLLVELGVLCLVLLALQHPLVDEELAPLVIGVARKQRIVEIEQAELHGSSALSASRTSGKVTCRWRSSEVRSMRSRIAPSEGRSRRTWLSRYQITSSASRMPRRSASARR